MNYLHASIRGVEFKKIQIPNSIPFRRFGIGTKKIKYDAGIGELNSKGLKLLVKSPDIYI